MARITIVGAGITGMAIASLLSRNHEVTIIAKNLPGDELSQDWASPWAGAVFLGLDGSNPREQKMQLDSFAVLWSLAVSNPESSIRRIEMNDFHDDKTIDEIWYKGKMPDFQVMKPSELPKGVKLGMSYRTVVLTPKIFLPWLRQRLEDSGVVFKRMNLSSLSDAKSQGQDILINATGYGSKFLGDIRDQDVQLVRGQTVHVKSNYDKIYMRHGKDYTYAISRLDGTCILGGIKQYGNTDPEVDMDLQHDIIRRVHQDLPDVFPAEVSDYEVVGHNVGIRPARATGLRVEKEIMAGEKVVHAYGVAGGGYVFSFGVARAARDLVDEYVYQSPLAKL
ncbi:nucleotide-binding domain-containing protein [Cucurbitaria berberidis CBS 394.84]|uniref:Nucleotide-binding domain-containing protein n=1 Tax=Cucurbitaria berberidis CBS 394.84 TaxID=1168544 RepID=A0A9P4GGK2_9PLEO|nr:nucleotide-binding domain-containing protein [Cucurbitaria berberidis CBS 394.84]KAF1845054.1 nucleotide-binding domain-containing protein [Cucurbitaria berberidis CBS 394.84]